MSDILDWLFDHIKGNISFETVKKLGKVIYFTYCNQRYSITLRKEG